MGNGSSVVHGSMMVNSRDPVAVRGGYPVQMDVEPTYQGRPRLPPAIVQSTSHPQEPAAEPIVIDVGLVEEYVCLEREIASMEKGQPLQRLQKLVEKMQKLVHEIKDLQTRLEHVEEEKNVDPEVNGEDLIKEIDDIEGKPKEGKIHHPMSHIERIKTLKEVVELELKEKRRQYSECEKELEELNNKVAHLLDCYLKEDEILVCMFSQGHVNEKEAALSRKLTQLEEKKERIDNARKAWKEAQLLLEYSCKKLALAVQQWQDLPEMPKICLEVKYCLSEEVETKMRDMGRSMEMDEDFCNLPHCTPEELAALEAMAAGSPPGTVDERYLKCLNNYSECHKRAICMLKWFNKVLNTTIHRDLVEVCEEVRQTSQAVRVERVQVLKQKIKEMRGQDFNFDAEQKKTVAEEGVKKAINGYKAKMESKNKVKLRRGSQSSIDKVSRRGSREKILISNGGNDLKSKARMEQRLGQQLSDGRRLRNERMTSAVGPPPAQPAPAPPTPA